MTKPILSSKNGVYWILAGAVVVYSLLIFTYPFAVLLTGIYLLVLFLLLTGERRPMWVLLHLTAIVTYPLYFFAWLYLLPVVDPSRSFSVNLLPIIAVSYAIIYALLWRSKFWTDFPKRFIIPFLISVALILIGGWLFTDQFVRCAEISVAEKGVTTAEIQSCANLHLYSPGTAVPGTWIFRVSGLIPPALILVLLTPFAYLPKKKNEA